MVDVCILMMLKTSKYTPDLLFLEESILKYLPCRTRGFNSSELKDELVNCDFFL